MAAVAAAPGSANAPNATLYARNLEERIKIDQLKEALTEIFSEYGNVIDVVAKKNLKAKGQAFIVFDEIAAAQKALEEVQGFELFDKAMVLDYAKTQSDATLKLQGDDAEFEVHKQKRLAEKERRNAAEAAEMSKQNKRTAGAVNGPSESMSTGKPIKAARGAGLKSSNPAGGAVIPEEYLPPNKILFIQQLPDDYGIEALTTIFGRFEGFKEVRLVPGRKGLAFVEYEAEVGAIAAKERTSGMTLGDAGRPIKVTYQRQ